MTYKTSHPVLSATLSLGGGNVRRESLLPWEKDRMRDDMEATENRDRKAQRN